MIFTDALSATIGPWPITRQTSEGYRMLGYLDGSVEVVKQSRVAKAFPAGTGPTWGYTDWEPGHGPMVPGVRIAPPRGAQEPTEGAR